MSEPSWQHLSQEAHGIWEQNAPFWDDYMGEGNDFHRLLIAPATERLLSVRKGERVLDVACGNGSFSRRLADLGATVTACDISEAFITRARARSQSYAGRVEYRWVDATDRAQLLALGPGRFDAAMCNMALMDIPTLEPLLEALHELLVPSGRFVFSVMHPAFNSPGITRLGEEEDRDGSIVTQYSIRVHSYITPMARKGLGIVGQPVPQFYFHRPLSVLFGACFKAGFVVDGLEEPVFPREADAHRCFSWSNYNEIPPALVARLKMVRL